MDEEAIRKVLARAAALQEHGLQDSATVPLEQQAAVKEFLDAAEEGGFARGAVVHALHESAPVLPPSVTPGSLVFAPSGDGETYVAKVLAIKDGQVEVRFFNGATARVYCEAVEPFAPLPGQMVLCQRVDDWLEAEILEYDPKKHYIRAKGEWGTSGFDLGQVRKWKPAEKPAGKNLTWLLLAIVFILGFVVSELTGSRH
ncbi:MAG: hypothetical protein JSS66_17355 [Armatimonadetes bacterium]|nr:hypothetical protein [Armatimonadota bacterium]